MNYEYNLASRYEGFGRYGSVGFKVEVAIKRQLSEEESNEIDAFVRQMTSKIHNNNYKVTEEYKTELDEERKGLIECFPSPIYVKEATNEYGGLTPWFIVTTPKGNIKIGWRKRVILIDWDGSDIKEKAEELFTQEDTTKYDRTIHAWGYEKAKDYISILLR